MNTTKNSQSTPPGYWFGVIEHNLRAKMRADLADLGLRRGTWRILHTLADGPATAEDIAAKLPHTRDGKGRRGRAERGRGFGRGFGPGFGRGFGPDFGPDFGGRRFGRFASEEEREAFFEERRAEFHERFPTEEERRAFFAGRSRGRGFGSGYGHGPHGHSHHDHDEHHHGAPSDHDEHDHNHGRGDHHGHGHNHGHGDHHNHHGNAARGRRSDRIGAVLGDFAARGWVTFDEGAAILTDAGREAHDAAFERIRSLRESVADGISEADYATTLATLEAMARNLGWTDKDQPEQADEPEQSTPES